jgi:hypothetical protein
MVLDFVDFLEEHQFQRCSLRFGVDNHLAAEAEAGLLESLAAGIPLPAMHQNQKVAGIQLAAKMVGKCYFVEVAGIHLAAGMAGKGHSAGILLAVEPRSTVMAAAKMAGNQHSVEAAEIPPGNHLHGWVPEMQLEVRKLQIPASQAEEIPVVGSHLVESAGEKVFYLHPLATCGWEHQ